MPEELGIINPHDMTLTSNVVITKKVHDPVIKYIFNQNDPGKIG